MSCRKFCGISFLFCFVFSIHCKTQILSLPSFFPSLVSFPSAGRILLVHDTAFNFSSHCHFRSLIYFIFTHCLPLEFCPQCLKISCSFLCSAFTGTLNLPMLISLSLHFLHFQLFYFCFHLIFHTMGHRVE
jgi:hypothetical protein